MAILLLQGRAIPSPATTSSSIYGTLSSSPFEAQLLWDSEHSRDPHFATRRSSLNLCRAAALPQRPFGEQQRSRQDVGGRAGPEVNSLKQPKHAPTSLESTLPVRSTSTLGQSSVWNILSPLPSHAPPISFLSQELQDEALLSDSDDEDAIRRSAFTMVLAICSAVQLLCITDAVRLWVARLRLRYFDSPFTYRHGATKLGRIGIFWDIENCPIPGGLDAQMVVKQMQRVGASFGTVQCLRAYGKLEYLTRQAPSLLSMGVELCPVPDGKESADKAIIMDALLFGYDHKPCPDTPAVEKDASTGNGIVLVTGDRGFCALLRELSNRYITTVVIGNGHQRIPPILAQAADYCVQWDEMMEIPGRRSSSYGLQYGSFREKVSIMEEDHFEFGGWDASSSCNVLLKYEFRDEQIPSSCEKSDIVEGCEYVEPLGSSSDKRIAGSLSGERKKHTNASFMNTTATSEEEEEEEEVLSTFDSNSRHDHSRNECNECKDLEMGICTEEFASSKSSSPCVPSSASSSGKARDVRRPPVDVDYSSYMGPKVAVPPVGGRVRILRYLRCEVAYVVDKYCKGKPKAVMTFDQFEMLYELETGHPLVTSHYGFANLKSILQSMPDLLSVRNVSLDAADWRIFPYIKSGIDRKPRVNFSRQDLRCILYKILHSFWPHGVPKDHISSEHCKLTGRPLVLVAYEYWRLTDMIQSLGDMLYVDDKNKHLYLADTASEPRGFREREQNRWN